MFCKSFSFNNIYDHFVFYIKLFVIFTIILTQTTNFYESVSYQISIYKLLNAVHIITFLSVLHFLGFHKTFYDFLDYFRAYFFNFQAFLKPFHGLFLNLQCKKSVN